MFFSRICWCKVFLGTYSKTKTAQESIKLPSPSVELSRLWNFPKDYCAGRGGKTWFLATLVAPFGTVCAWDIQEDLRKQLEGARAKRTLGELGFDYFLGAEGSCLSGFLFYHSYKWWFQIFFIFTPTWGRLPF